MLAFLYLFSSLKNCYWLQDDWSFEFNVPCLLDNKNLINKYMFWKKNLDVMSTLDSHYPSMMTYDLCPL